MRLSFDVCGYYDWTECPPGTQITQADADALRVKQLADGKWHMKVEHVRDTHHDVGVHEEAVCQRFAALEKHGEECARESVVLDLIRPSMRHHLAPRHILAVDVHDDGPNETLLRAAMDAVGLAGPAADAALARYQAPVDLKSFLTATLVKGRKAST